MTDQTDRDDTTADLPDGTDTVIEGAVEQRSTRQPIATTATTANCDRWPTAAWSIASATAASSSPARPANERAGFVTQGLERTSEALANVSKMIGDTAAGIEERLGEEYGDYARRAAGSIENVANPIAAKDPDELIEDTRNFVRNSPGIALAGAAVVGFVVARLLKTGLARTKTRMTTTDAEAGRSRTAAA